MSIMTTVMVRRILCRIASENGRSVGELLTFIRRNIYMGLHSSDPKVCSAWRAIPCEGTVPTPVEAILYWTARRLSAEAENQD